jgi:hypothetical protein
MRVPTSAQIAASHAGILESGPMSEDTMVLMALTMRDPITRRICERMAEHAGIMLPVILGAFVAGLNLGLRVETETLQCPDCGHEADAREFVP